MARQYHREMVSERGLDTEAQVLEVIQSLFRSSENGTLTLGDITSRFTDLYGDEYEKNITTKWVGYILRQRLHLKPRKSNGIFVIPPEEHPKLARLYDRYGVASQDPTESASTVAPNAIDPHPGCHP